MIKIKLLAVYIILNAFSNVLAQVNNDYLPAKFHKQKRQVFRSKMPENTVALFFSNPIRNRSNDVDYIFHQDPNFYYLTGFRDPNSVLVIFSNQQKDESGNSYNEIIYVPKRDAVFEMWNGKQLGVKGVKEQLGFKTVKTSESFAKNNINFKQFNKVFVTKFKDDYRNTIVNKGEVFDLVKAFKAQSKYNTFTLLSKAKKKVYELICSAPIRNSANVAQVIGKVLTTDTTLKEDELIEGYFNAKNEKQKLKFKEKVNLKLANQTNIDVNFIPQQMATLREIKTSEELKLLTKAIRISAIGQIEVMKAMKPHMTEREVQGIHEFVFKKYGAAYEGYPSIVGSGNNGCFLHYIKNHDTYLGNDLVLMDLGAEYRGYTADVTRTIPANGKFSTAQKAIYEIVLEAQTAGILVCKAGNSFWAPGQETKRIINKGLYNLGIIKSTEAKHSYFPHGTSHHIGLDVHDATNYGNLKENMVITVEPGIYIPEGSKCDKKWWGIAIRIEDDILITKDTPKNLSSEAPRTVKAIEEMMAKKSVLNDWLLPNLD